jgi:hypothetical protein
MVLIACGKNEMVVQVAAHKPTIVIGFIYFVIADVAGITDI